MKWENYGCHSKKGAEYVKKWLDEHGIRTGEIFNCYETWVVPYMAIGSLQKELVSKEARKWCFELEL